MSDLYSSDRPAFIVGVPRSGTTLMVNLLGAHPSLAPVYETRFIRNLLILCDSLASFYRPSMAQKAAALLIAPLLRSRLKKQCEEFRRKAIQYSGDGGVIDKQKHEFFPFGQLHCIYYTEEELIRETDLWLQRVQTGAMTCDSVWSSAREYVNRLFAIHCDRMQKPHWINKTPGFLTYLDRLSRLYPDARFIHMIRDGRDVTASNLALRWGPNTVREGARRWRMLLSKGQRVIDRCRLQCKVVRYEELVESPASVLRDVFEFLQLDADIQAILKFMPVSQERRGTWQSVFTAKDRQVFDREAGDLLIDLGYERNHDWAKVAPAS